MNEPEAVPPPDHHHLSAASGWLDLGNSREARSELARVSDPNRHHPAVLDLEWRICAFEKRWEEAAAVAARLTEVNPESPSGWIHRSFALHELRRTEEAWTTLLSIAHQHPGVAVIPYNLACYACQLGRLDDARQWLAKAMQIGEAEEVRRMALEDRDLQPLWEEIRRSPTG